MVGAEAPRDSPPTPPGHARGLCPSRRWVALILLLGLPLLGWGWRWYHVTRPAYRLQRAREAMQARDWEEAEDVADQLQLAGQPDLAHLIRGELHFRRGQHARAIAELNLIQDRGALRLEAAVLSGRCLLQLGEAREADQVFHFVVEQQPENVDAHRGLAAIAYDQGSLVRAVHHLSEVARLDPADGRPHRLVGLIRKDMSQWAEAEPAYAEALRRDLPVSFRHAVYLELAECQAQRHVYATALKTLDERREAGGEEGAAVLALRGECLWGLQVPEARALLDRALREHPAEARLLALRGQIHLSDRQPAQAADLLERAVRAAPYEHRYRHQLARAYAGLRRSADAAEQQRRAGEIEGDLHRLTSLSREATEKPWDAEVRTRLAEVCRKLDKQPLADMWERAAAVCRAGPGSLNRDGK